MALIDQWNATYSAVGVIPPSVDNSTLFERRVIMAAIAAAVSIGNEGTGTPNHTNRVALAKVVTNKPLDWMQAFAMVCASQGLDQNSLDTAISNMIAAVWNPMAGAV